VPGFVRIRTRRHPGRPVRTWSPVHRRGIDRGQCKDKALSLGSQPTGTAGSKRSSARLAGTLLKDGDAGVLLEYDSGNANYLLPEGLPKNAPDDPAGAWKEQDRIQQSSSDKAGTEVPFDSFVAFLPAGVADLAALCKERRVAVDRREGQEFSHQVELMSAAVKAYGTDPAMAPLEKYVGEGMRSRYEAFENGVGGIDVLNRGSTSPRCRNRRTPSRWSRTNCGSF